MNLEFTENGWKDYLHWSEENREVLIKINLLIRDLLRDPMNKGLGKAERLSGKLNGFYSRRINHEHRLVYRMDQHRITIISCRYHYPMLK